MQHAEALPASMASPQLGIVWPLWFVLFGGWVLVLR